MKAERINNDQVRFILDGNDLMQHNIRFSELAYGSAKTQALFDDMMKTALDKFGMDFSEKSLMIEAIPLGGDRLSITVTKVEGMAEVGQLIGANLPGSKNQDFMPKEPLAGVETTLQKAPARENQPKDPSSMKMGTFPESETVTYEFKSMENLLKAAAQVPSNLSLKNMLMYDEQTNAYLLTCFYKGSSPEIRYLITMLPQFADEWYVGERLAMVVEEHARKIYPQRALQKLGEVQRVD